MKVKILISMFSILLIVGCFSYLDKHKVQPPVRHSQLSLSKGNVAEAISNINQSIEVGHWTVIMHPEEVNPLSADLVDYKVECKYHGSSKVTNAKIKWGNGSAELKDIAYGEGGTIGSSFPKDTKEIEFSITTSEENGATYAQTLVFKTGQ